MADLRGVLLHNATDLATEQTTWVRDAGRAYPAPGVAYDLEGRLRRMYEEAPSRQAAAGADGVCWHLTTARHLKEPVFAKRVRSE